MKRIFLILLMMLLPLQAAWSAGYCRLLTEAGDSQSFDSLTPDIQDNGDEKQRGFGESGCCASCHSVCHLPAIAFGSCFKTSNFEPCSMLVQRDSIVPYQSHVPDGPIRPKWTPAS